MLNIILYAKIWIEQVWAEGRKWESLGVKVAFKAMGMAETDNLDREH